MSAPLRPNAATPRVSYIPVKNAEFFVREVGEGRAMMILHGGPDLDFNYLLPEMDALSDTFRLIYYDQRGRGRSANNVRPEDVTIESEVKDLERLRRHLQLETMILLGHSWGGVLASEYVTRYPQRVSHLILLNSAPVSHRGYLRFQQQHTTRWADNIQKLEAITGTVEYREGDPEIMADYFRIHFSASIRQPQQLERMVENLKVGFTPEGILKSRAIEERLMEETWLSSDYNLLPKLERIRVPARVIHGDYDFIPVECVEPIAQAIPDAKLVVLKDTGHFAYLESADEFRKEISDFVL